MLSIPNHHTHQSNHQSNLICPWSKLCCILLVLALVLVLVLVLALLVLALVLTLVLVILALFLALALALTLVLVHQACTGKVSMCQMSPTMYSQPASIPTNPRTRARTSTRTRARPKVGKYIVHLVRGHPLSFITTPTTTLQPPPTTTATTTTSPPQPPPQKTTLLPVSSTLSLPPRSASAALWPLSLLAQLAQALQLSRCNNDDEREKSPPLKPTAAIITTNSLLAYGSVKIACS